MGLLVHFRPRFVVKIQFYDATGLVENPLPLISFSSLLCTTLALGVQVAYLEI